MNDAEGLFWLYQVPNLILAMLMYTIIGRFILSLIFPPESDRVVWRVFVQITDPVIKSVAAVTPLAVPDRLILIFAFVWLFALRIALYIVMRMYGLAPSIAG
jgi:YggT family protein